MMDSYRGTYYLKDGEAQDAIFVFLKDKLSIGLRDEYGNQRLVYWYYDQVIKEKVWKTGHAELRYSGHPQQVIETRSKEFADRIEEILFRRHSGISRVYNRRNAALWKVAIAVIAILAGIYFWLIPFMAVRLAARVPVSYEKQLGDRLFAAIKSGYTVDQSRTAYVNDFFDEMKISSPYDIRITVVKQDQANAFAMPGGHIVVYDKILSNMKSYEELAALLSHEFIHVHNRHTTKTIFRRMASRIFLSVTLGDLGAVGSVILNNADKLKTLSYSRSLEKEADLEGLKILAERKIDGNGFVGLFNILKEGTGTEPAEWINSHPNLEKRIQYVKNSAGFNRGDVMANETLQGLFLRIKTTE